MHKEIALQNGLGYDFALLSQPAFLNLMVKILFLPIPFLRKFPDKKKILRQAKI